MAHAEPSSRPSLHTRLIFGVLALGTIAVGLMVRQLGAAFPSPLRDVIGDALWAMMIFWWIGVLAPGVRLEARAALALAVCWGVEFSQLYHAPSLDGWRQTTLGTLVLGTDFDARDLAAYALGVLAAMMLERASQRSRGR